MGLRKMVSRKTWKDLHKEIRLEVDGRIIDLPPVEGIIILNILSWGSGANPWGPEREDNFSKPTHYDGMLEIVGVMGVVHMGQIQSGLRSAIRIAQGGHAKQAGVATSTMCLNEEIVQPFSPAQIAFQHFYCLKVLMLRVRSGNTYQHISDYNKDRIVVYTRIAVYRITVLLFASVEIQQLLAEYAIDGFKMVLRDAVLDLTSN
ncbi:diacylglycerol kinase theta [Trichonephila clavipes]|nr:diacylglycerol kinase theta [Trichonephila clavipes]